MLDSAVSDLRNELKAKDTASVTAPANTSTTPIPVRVGDASSIGAGIASWPFLETLQSSSRPSVETEGIASKNLDTDVTPAKTVENEETAVENLYTDVTYTKTVNKKLGESQPSNVMGAFKRPRDPRTPNTHPGSKTGEKRSQSRSRTFIGKGVSNGRISWKGADMTVNRYIGRVDSGVDMETVRAHVVDAGINVVEMEQLVNKHTRFKSFRLCVKKSDLHQIENEDFWPEGVMVRPFHRQRSPRSADDVSSAILQANRTSRDTTVDNNATGGDGSGSIQSRIQIRGL
jgi:hypothetical protein